MSKPNPRGHLLVCFLSPQQHLTEGSYILVRDGILKNFPKTAFPKCNSDYCDQNYYYRNKNFILTKQTSKDTFNFAFSSLFANLEKLSLASQGFLRSKMYLFSKGLSSAFGKKGTSDWWYSHFSYKENIRCSQTFHCPPKNVLKNVHKPKVGNTSHMNASYNHITHDEHWCFWYSINTFIHTA